MQPGLNLNCSAPASEAAACSREVPARDGKSRCELQRLSGTAPTHSLCILVSGANHLLGCCPQVVPDPGSQRGRPTAPLYGLKGGLCCPSRNIDSGLVRLYRSFPSPDQAWLHRILNASPTYQDIVSNEIDGSTTGSSEPSSGCKPCKDASIRSRVSGQSGPMANGVCQA